MQPRKPERLLRGIERCPVLPLVAREPRHQSVPWSRAPRLVRVAASAADCGPSLLAPRTAELWRRGASRAPGKRRLALHTAEDLPAGQQRQGRGLGECGWLDGRGQLFSKETGAALRLSGGWGVARGHAAPPLASALASPPCFHRRGVLHSRVQFLARQAERRLIEARAWTRVRAWVQAWAWTQAQPRAWA